MDSFGSCLLTSTFKHDHTREEYTKSICLARMRGRRVSLPEPVSPPGEPSHVILRLSLCPVMPVEFLALVSPVRRSRDMCFDSFEVTP